MHFLALLLLHRAAETVPHLSGGSGGQGTGTARECHLPRAATRLPSPSWDPGAPRGRAAPAGAGRALLRRPGASAGSSEEPFSGLKAQVQRVWWPQPSPGGKNASRLQSCRRAALWPGQGVTPGAPRATGWGPRDLPRWRACRRSRQEPCSQSWQREGGEHRSARRPELKG